MTKYLITGVSVRSKGGEAMVYETYRKIKAINPENEISLFSTNPEYDQSFINSAPDLLELKVINGLQPRYLKNKYFNYFFTRFLEIKDISSIFLNKIHMNEHYKQKVAYTSPLFHEIASCDCVLQIAGISFSKQFGRFSAYNWMKKMIIASLMKKKFFCMPQSIGPSNDWIINLFAKIGLNSVTYIMPRGNKSIEYLKQLHLKHNRIQFVPDLAFSFHNPSDIHDQKIYSRYELDPTKKYVAVLFNTHLFNWGGKAMIATISSVIDDMVESKGYSVLLIAHEVNDKNRIDDRYVNSMIHELCKNKSSVINIQDDLRANEVKSLIKLCDFTICSRFHGMISSLKVGVVPIVIGWADKYFEIMKLFNLEDLVVDYSQVNIEAVEEKILYVLAHNPELREQILYFLPRYENSSEIMKEIVKNNI